MRLTTTSILAALLAPGAALAEPPRIVVDVAPIHSLVAQVTGEVVKPDLLIEGVVDPHALALRPSQAAHLQEADVFILAGEGLTPWIEGALDGLPGDTITLELLETDCWEMLGRREEAVFPVLVAADADHDDHDDHDHDHDDHDHDHSDHDEADGKDHDSHDHTGHDGHDHGAGDPHAWLSPAVSRVWIGLIADTLAEADPDNADSYRANAERAQSALTMLEQDLAKTLPRDGGSYIVAHDALQYFEQAFGIPASGALALSDAESPGPQRIRALQGMIADAGVDCILTDPTVSADWASLLAEGTEARIAFVDPLGGAIEPGPDHHATTLRSIAETLNGCLAR